MIHTRKLFICGACLLLALGAGSLQPPKALAHGALSMEGDTCVMKAGPYKVHFSGYAPETKPSQEFCEDIPDAGRSVIALDQVDKALRRMAMEVRILRDAKDLGVNARYEQLGGQQDIEAATLIHKAAEVYPRGNATVELDLVKGNYIGYVKLYDPETKGELVSVFPFAVGYGAGKEKLGWLIQAFFGLTAAGGAVYFIVVRPRRSAGKLSEKAA
jgi:hypothetical protein